MLMSRTWKRVRAGALRGLAYGLDPYSTYLTPEQVAEFRSEKKGNQVGIGAELSQYASYLYVVAPVKGSPADQAGIRAGDVIEYIDNKATRDISLYDAPAIAEWRPGSEVNFAVLRVTRGRMTVSGEARHVSRASAERSSTPAKIGILRINSLGCGRGCRYESALAGL
jgi:carboxyl-terminal processing protease